MTTTPETGGSALEAALLQAIRDFFDSRTEDTGPRDPDRLTGRAIQLAATVLFLQVIAADHDSKHDEHRTLIAAVKRVLDIDETDASTIIRFAETKVRTPLAQVLRTLDLDCTLGQKKRIVQSMWELAFADAELAGHEEYFVRKVAHALHLNNADLVETKILAREAFLAG